MFAAAGVDLVTAITMTYPAEAIGIANAARAAGVPVVISFTVETDGTLPSGRPLGDAISRGRRGHRLVADLLHDQLRASDALRVDPLVGALGRAHPRIRANASRMTHAELDEAEELDAGDPDELAAEYAELRRSHPQLSVLGGCCGTSDRHIDAISTACAVS